MKCIICDWQMEKLDLEDGWIKEVCLFHANCNTVYKEEYCDLIFVNDLFKTSTYNLREPFGYIAVGSST